MLNTMHAIIYDHLEVLRLRWKPLFHLLNMTSSVSLNRPPFSGVFICGYKKKSLKSPIRRVGRVWQDVIATLPCFHNCSLRLVSRGVVSNETDLWWAYRGVLSSEHLASSWEVCFSMGPEYGLVMVSQMVHFLAHLWGTCDQFGNFFFNV